MKYLIILLVTLITFDVDAVIPMNFTDCDAIKKEIEIFGKTMPSGLRRFKDNFIDCEIKTINQVEINDYLNMEYDSLLTLSYLSFKEKTTHNRLLTYYLDEERWDLLLMTINMMKDFNKNVQIKSLEQLFYLKLPFYFSVEIKEVFNFLTESEKLQISQQLIPNTIKKLKFLTKNNGYILEFWPSFDQLVFINHLRENFPNQFDKLNLFWREKLVSFHYSEFEEKDITFKLLNKLLIAEIVEEVEAGVNPSFQFYYYVKSNQFEQASSYIQSIDKQAYFNSLRYFQLFSPEQKTYLLDLNINLTISDIRNLFDNLYFQVEDPLFQKWVWEKSIELKVNLDELLDSPYQIYKTMPAEFRSRVKDVAPKTWFVHKDRLNDNHYFMNDPTSKIYPTKMSAETVSVLSRFYNSHKKVPYEDPSKIIHAIFPYIKLNGYQEFIDLLPYLTFSERLELIERYPELAILPKEYWRSWSVWFVKELYN